MNKIKAILIDLDGVVVNPHNYFNQRYVKDFQKNLNDDLIVKFFKNVYPDCASASCPIKLSKLSM